MVYQRQKVDMQIYAKQILPSVNTHFYTKRMQDKEIKIKEIEVLNLREEVKEILLTQGG